MIIRSRRDFIKDTLRSVTAFGAMGGLAKFGEMNSFAAGSGYQALVCIFLAGGNDGHNTVVPITTAQQNYNLYQQGRGPLAIAQNALLQVLAIGQRGECIDGDRNLQLGCFITAPHNPCVNTIAPNSMQNHLVEETAEQGFLLRLGKERG